tara:strand:+ start:902 stop:2518 length:1617 start_codon:yes stop_codon:yes gene_type:complete
LEIKSKYLGNKRKLILSSILLSCLIILPLLALIFSIFGVEASSFFYLWDNLLLDYSIDTIYLVTLVSFFSLILGVIPAWFVSTTNFPAKNIYDVMLYLPLAIPSYIMAFTYSDILSYTGPLQVFIREYLPKYSYFFNHDYLQIEILGIIMALSLYPYIYTSCRISFSLIGSNYIYLAKSLGIPPLRTFFKIIVPISRVSIFSGLFLVIMEVLNEYGAVRYFGINTFTSGIFRSWNSMQDVETASLLALILFAVVFIFFFTERILNSKFKFNYTPNTEKILANRAKSSNSFLMHISCLVPILFGFIIPLIFIISNVVHEFNEIDFSRVLELTSNTVFISLIATFIIILIAVYFQFTRRIFRNSKISLFNETVSLTYAIPGAVISLALIILATSTPLNSQFLIGSFFLLIYAYVIRYMAVGISPLKSSFEKHPISYDDMAFSLGMSPLKLFKKVHYPINKSAIAVAFLITFVDIIKELPITLILSPFNFSTLSVQAYQYAIDEMIPKSAIYSLLIIVLGAILLIFLKIIVNRKVDVSKNQ